MKNGGSKSRSVIFYRVGLVAKGGITPEEDHEDLTTSWKIEGRSEYVVKMKPFQVYKIILRAYHVITTFTPRPCQVLTTSIRFPMSSYHALTTLTPFIVRSYYVLNTTKQTALRAYHAFTRSNCIFIIFIYFFRTYFTTTNTNIFN